MNDLKIYDIIKSNEWKDIKMAYKLVRASNYSKIEFIILLMVVMSIPRRFGVHEGMRWWINNNPGGAEMRLMYNSNHEFVFRAWLTGDGILSFRSKMSLEDRYIIDVYDSVVDVGDCMFRGDVLTEEIWELMVQRMIEVSNHIGCLFMKNYRELMLQNEKEIIKWFERCLSNGG